jgi:hypothetical protein
VRRRSGDGEAAPVGPRATPHRGGPTGLHTDENEAMRALSTVVVVRESRAPVKKSGSDNMDKR